MEEKIYVCILFLVIKSIQYNAAPMVTPTPTLPSIIAPVSRSTPMPIPAHMDVNEGRCNGEDEGCCTTEKPCARNEGDCDYDSDCVGDLVCGNNNCFWGESDDCCEYDDQNNQKDDRRLSEAGDYEEPKPQQRSTRYGNAYCLCNYKTDASGHGVCNHADNRGLYCYVDKGVCVEQYKSWTPGLFFSYYPCTRDGCVCNGDKDANGNGVCNLKHYGRYYCFVNRLRCNDEHAILGSEDVWSHNACKRRCTGQNDGCCTSRKPCAIGEGDCDHHLHCVGHLLCGTNNCFWGGEDDCCEQSDHWRPRSNNESTNAVSYKVSSNGRAAQKYAKLMGVYFANGESINDFPIYENREHQFMYVDVGGWWNIGPNAGSPASFIHNPRRSVTEEPFISGWQYANIRWYTDPTLKVIAVAGMKDRGRK